MNLRTSVVAISLLAMTVVTVYGGISGTGRSKGVLSRVSSVVVTGVLYETAGAEVVVNGLPGTEADFAPGQTISVFGTVNADGVTGTADRVVIDDVLRGSVDDIDPAANSISVAGQELSADLNTLFDRQSGIAGFAIGDDVRVFGVFDAGGDLVPTRIAASPGPATVLVTGDADDVSGTLIEINDLVVDVSGAATVPVVNVGDRVRVEGIAFGSGGELLATSAAVVELQETPPVGSSFSLSGIVDDVDGSMSFSIDGTTILVDANTAFVGPQPSIGATVLADSIVGAAGITAAVVRTLADPDVRITGEVIETDDDEITLDDGSEIDIDDLTAFQDLSDVAEQRFGIEHINVGDVVDIRAIREDDDELEFDATAVIRLLAGAGDDDD